MIWARQELPDLMIIDYQMPHFSGLEVCQQLKQDPRTDPASRRSFRTARGYDLDPQMMQSIGIVRVLSKPFSPRQLRQR